MAISTIVFVSAEEPEFDWNWTYKAPTCEGLKVTFPVELPHDAIDINIRVKDLITGEIKTFNFRDVDGFEKGVEHTFTIDLKYFEYQWIQVHGTNYHWEGSVVCGEEPVVEPPVIEPDKPVEPVEPVEPDKPVEPVEPDKPVEPVEPPVIEPPIVEPPVVEPPIVEPPVVEPPVVSIPEEPIEVPVVEVPTVIETLPATGLQKTIVLPTLLIGVGLLMLIIGKSKLGYKVKE